MKIRNYVLAIVLFRFTLVPAGVALGGELFVSPDGTGDGSSWNSPLGAIQEALDISGIGDDIHVKEGTYLESIVMVEGVDLFGGYSTALTDTDVSERNPATYVTSISALGPSNLDHVVIGANSATIDGFTLTGGQADSNGGGMFNDSCSPTITNCVFFDNTAVGGGGMYNFESSPTIINCAFWSNNAGLWGGGIYNLNSHPTIINCTFFRNETNGYGRSIFNSYSSPTVTNCILWSDSTPFQAEIFDHIGSSPTVTYCNVAGGYFGTGNISAEPLFVDPGYGDFHLQSGSPCIDVGNNDAIPVDVTEDFEGDERIVDGGTVDMGVDEYAATVLRANFKGDPTAGPPPLTVEFADYSTGFPSAWSWDFDNDGAEDATGQNPSHTYTNEGCFTVSLTITGNGQDTATKTDYVVIAMPPEAAFSANVTDGPRPLTVQFTDQTTGVVTDWSWDFDGDGTEDSTKQNPSFTYDNAGDYTVSITVIGPGGWDVETKVDYIHVVQLLPSISQLHPSQQEPTVAYTYMARWLGNQLYSDPNAITTTRWGRVGIYGDNFGSSRMPGDQVRIGEPQAKNGGARDVLRYSIDDDPYTVEDVGAGVSLKVGPWSNDMVGVYLFPADGEIVRALYGPGNPGLGLTWLDRWLGVWIVKNDGGTASNVKPVRVLAPLPD